MFREGGWVGDPAAQQAVHGSYWSTLKLRFVADQTIELFCLFVWMISVKVQRRGDDRSAFDSNSKDRQQIAAAMLTIEFTLYIISYAHDNMHTNCLNKFLIHLKSMWSCETRWRKLCNWNAMSTEANRDCSPKFGLWIHYFIDLNLSYPNSQKM